MKTVYFINDPASRIHSKLDAFFENHNITDRIEIIPSEVEDNRIVVCENVLNDKPVVGFYHQGNFREMSEQDFGEVGDTIVLGLDIIHHFNDHEWFNYIIPYKVTKEGYVGPSGELLNTISIVAIIEHLSDKFAIIHVNDNKVRTSDFDVVIDNIYFNSRLSLGGCFKRDLNCWKLPFNANGLIISNKAEIEVDRSTSLWDHVSLNDLLEVCPIETDGTMKVEHDKIIILPKNKLTSINYSICFSSSIKSILSRETTKTYYILNI